MKRASSIFQVLDFDRVLFDTAAFIRAVIEEIEQQNYEQGELLADKVQKAYEKEETFFLFRYLRKTKGDAWVEQLVNRVVQRRGQSTFLLPGLAERIAFADAYTDLQPAWGIMTYGDTVDQLMKLRIAGLEQAPCLITNSPNKSAIIASWQQPDGSFVLPDTFGGQVVQSISLEDDKLRAFHDMPKHMVGIWITSDADAKKRLEATKLSGVVIARDLHESIQILKDF